MIVSKIGEVIERRKTFGEIGWDTIIHELDGFSCQENVLKSALSVSSSLTNLLNETFDSSDKINLRFSNKNFNNFQAETRTNPKIEKTGEGNYTINIEFNTNFLKKPTNLGLIVTALHESIHAYMLHLHQQGKLSKVNSKYTRLEELLIEFYKGKRSERLSIDLQEEHHNVMHNFIRKIGNATYEFAKANKINVSKSYCNNLAWGTMHSTSIFKNMLSKEEQIKFNNIYYTEAYNEKNEDYIPKGTPCD